MSDREPTCFLDVGRGCAKEDLEFAVEPDLARAPLEAFWSRCDDASALVWTAACLAAHDPPLLREVVAKAAAYVVAMLRMIPSEHLRADLGVSALAQWCHVRRGAVLDRADRFAHVAARASRAIEQIVLAAERCDQRCEGQLVFSQNIPCLAARAVQEAEGAYVVDAGQWDACPWFCVRRGDEVRAMISLESVGGALVPKVIR